jgi:Mg-chelatase subunit ChlD
MARSPTFLDASEMNLSFTHPFWLFALLPAMGWILWLTWKSDVAVSAWRRWTAFALRVLVLLSLTLALAGVQWLKPQEGMNVIYLLDRSDSVPAGQQELARTYVNQSASAKRDNDRAGVVVFGAEGSIEASVGARLELQKVLSVVGGDHTDLAGAIRLGAAAFPDAGQKRLVVLTDGNENLGDALQALASTLPLGITLDAVALGSARAGDAAIQRLSLPSTVKRGQTFEAKIFVLSDTDRPAMLRLYRNDQFLGEQRVQLATGKNLFTFPQTLNEQGFYGYDAQLEVAGDAVPQNNRASGFTSVRGEPRVLLVSAQPEADAPLAAALRDTRLNLRVVPVTGFPPTLAELQSYDAVVLSNVGAGDVDGASWRLLEAAVRDFGVGVVCVGGDNAYLAGGYKGTPLEVLLPVEMELDSRKVLPSGAVVLIIDRSGSMHGDKLEMAKTAAMASVDALTDRDLVGVIAFDGEPYVVVDLQRAQDRKKIMSSIAGIGLGGGTAMYPPMVRAFEMLRDAKAALKHCIVLTDGQSQPGDFEGITVAMAAQKITVSTVGIGEGIDGALLQTIAALGRGRFYEVPTPTQLPQIFLKETALVLKTAINEDPFVPRFLAATEPVRGISGNEYPQLLGHVATKLKARAEQPLATPSGDPLLAHWQHGLGRTVAFTSDARAKWAQAWLGWERYRQFWTQLIRWSLRRVASADLQVEIAHDNGEGLISVEAIDAQGNYRNFLTLEAAVISPKGQKQTVRLQQSGAGRYEGRFPMRDIGAHFVNVMEFAAGELRGAASAGVSVNYSPEFQAAGPNVNLLQRLASAGSGRLIDPAKPGDNPFFHGRKKTFQPLDLWEWLLRFAIVLFPLDVAVRRVQLDREEWRKAVATVRRWILFWRPRAVPLSQEESLAALLSRRDAVRVSRSQQVGVTPVKSADTPAAPSVAWSVSAEAIPATSAKRVATHEPDDQKPAESTAGRLLEAKRRAQRKLGQQ